MDFPILGLHHVTATVDDAQADLDFNLEALGLRLVKKTVNFDNHGVYHFYYGDEQGRPGTIWTTFPYRGRGVATGIKGAGQITTTSFSVPAGSLDTWRARLIARDYVVIDEPPRFDEESILVTDPSGLIIELIATTRDSRDPWPNSPLGEDAIRGLHSVTLTVRDSAATIEFMRDLLGFEIVNEMDARTRVAVNGDMPGKMIDVVHAPNAEAARNGLGTVHHVAMAIADGVEQLRLREEIERRGHHRDTGNGSPVLHVHLLSGAWRRAVRGGDAAPWLRDRRIRRRSRARAQASARCRTKSGGNRSGAADHSLLRCSPTSAIPPYTPAPRSTRRPPR